MVDNSDRGEYESDPEASNRRLINLTDSIIDDLNSLDSKDYHAIKNEKWRSLEDRYFKEKVKNNSFDRYKFARTLGQATAIAIDASDPSYYQTGEYRTTGDYLSNWIYSSILNTLLDIEGIDSPEEKREYEENFGSSIKHISNGKLIYKTIKNYLEGSGG